MSRLASRALALACLLVVGCGTPAPTGPVGVVDSGGGGVVFDIGEPDAGPG